MAVAYARQLGYARVAAVGFSMGASIVLRHAGLIGGVDAVVSVSGPGRWYYRGTKRMRQVHWAIEHGLGRVRHQADAEDQDQPRRLEAGSGPPGRGGGADLAGAAADRAR